MPFRCASGDYTHNEEPTLDALLGEPIVRLVMARDRVAEDHIRQLLDAVLRRRSLGISARRRGSGEALKWRLTLRNGEIHRTGPNTSTTLHGHRVEGPRSFSTLCVIRRKGRSPRTAECRSPGRPP